MGADSDVAIVTPEGVRLLSFDGCGMVEETRLEVRAGCTELAIPKAGTVPHTETME